MNPKTVNLPHNAVLAVELIRAAIGPVAFLRLYLEWHCGRAPWIDERLGSIPGALAEFVAVGEDEKAYQGGTV